jgi:hypothetical protein
VPAPLGQARLAAVAIERQAPAVTISLATLFLGFGYLIGGALTAICAADLIFSVPFSRVNLVFDVGFLACGLMLLYLSWNARDGCR